MENIKLKRLIRKFILVALSIMLSSSSVLADAVKVELGDYVYSVNGQVFVEDVESPDEYYLEKGVPYKYNYNSLAQEEYIHNLEAAKEAFNYINETRLGKGLEPFEWDEEMIRSTTVRSLEIGEKWAHKRPDGTSFATTSKIIRSECLGRTTSEDPKIIVNAWLNSNSGHKEALLSTEYKKAYISCVVSQGEKIAHLYVLHQR